MVGGVLCLFKKISWYLEGIFLFTKQEGIALNPSGHPAFKFILTLKIFVHNTCNIKNF